MSHYQSLNTSAAFTQFRVVDLEPSLAAAGSVRRVAALADDALQPELARVAEHQLAVTIIGRVGVR